MEDYMDNSELIRSALLSRENAYCPYSGYAVGAALLCADGTVYGGCNIENAAFTPGNCAERTAIFRAVSDGNRSFLRIAIVGGKKGQKPDSYAFPCGVCRQVMAEFVNPKTFKIIVATSPEDYKEYTLGELLPESFGPENLE